LQFLLGAKASALLRNSLLSYMRYNKLPFSNLTGTGVVRPLGALEEFLWLLDQFRPGHFVMAAEVSGSVSVGDWCKALDFVQARHPLFSVRIARNKEGRPCFYQDHTASIPLRVVQEANATRRWELEAELELSIPFDPTSAPLARAVLLHEERRAVFLLVTHPSIADGRSATFVIRDLLQTVSGKPADRLSVLPSLEEILGVTSNVVSYPRSDGERPAPPERPAVFVRKENTRPRIKSLSLTTALSSRLRERARQEGTTVHGALSSAFALAFLEVIADLSASPVWIFSPIDTRKRLGVGENCGVLVGSGMVIIESRDATGFWEISRAATARLGTAQSLEAIKAATHGMHQVMKNGIDVPTVAAVAARRFGHDILLTNLGILEYQTDFGELQLEAVWGPAFSARLVDAHSIGVATTDGAIRLLQTTFAAPGSLLETVEEILVTACATRTPVMASQLPS
jgi:Condensation domain